MLHWIKLLMKKPSLYKRRISSLESRIKKVAVYPFGNTEEQISLILSLISQKRVIEEVSSLAEKLKMLLTDEEYRTVALIAKGKSSVEIAEELGIKKHTALRQVNRAIKTVETLLIWLGYDQKRMEERFSKIQL